MGSKELLINPRFKIVLLKLKSQILVRGLYKGTYPPPSEQKQTFILDSRLPF